jgi:hypothetical protein
MLQSKQAPSKDKMGFQKESTFTKFAFSKQLKQLILSATNYNVANE